MIAVRRSEDRGGADHGWLDTRHTFSFAEYHDPRFMGFRSLRVINEDRVRPGEGFPPHSHRDMEILSYVLAGGLRHEDSTGGGGVIRPGQVQRMSAGTGVVHSEFNASDSEPVHFLQIWIVPERRGLAPGYEERTFADADRRNRLRLVASRDGAEGSVTIRQDVRVFATLLDPGAEVTHALAPGRHAWVQVARGAVALNGVALRAGDGASASGETALRLAASEPSEVLVFDLA